MYICRKRSDEKGNSAHIRNYTCDDSSLRTCRTKCLTSSTDNFARIGLLTPLTGALESFGQGWLNAATLAIEDLNELNTTFQFELVVEDTKTSTNGVRDAMQALIVENVSVVVGAAASFVTLAAIEMARDNQIPMISYASTTRTNQCRR
ncbi:MAG: amino acid ABC transporter substrate-binding protein [Methanobacteriota archaeon]|nr:MAG: amino acid ABC transporter substrate-binding protein [Euryarchaeota archaeon]